MVYLDYAAACPKVKYPCSNYGSFFNVNANYAYKEKQLLKKCEDRIKKAVGAKSGKVVFGGTSSQLIENLMTAINEETFFRNVLCSVYEHDSFFRYADNMSDNINWMKNLLIAYKNDPESYDQSFVIWQGVNNLTGEVFPVEEIGKLCHEYSAFYICDMTTMIGKVPIPTNIDQWCDCAVWSGHKLGTELGIGAMWISDGLDKWLNGFKLHGTPNLTGALALTQAVEEVCDKEALIERDTKWFNLVNELDRELDRANIKHSFIPTVPASEADKPFALAINAIRLPGFNADALQQYLASKQIYVSIGGSACAEKHDYRVLNAYGLNNDEASEVIRVSFGEDSNVEDVEALVEGIKNFKELYVK
jgi:cysteine sulfinate desulfinase/cysteine desulfurase-like protein